MSSRPVCQPRKVAKTTPALDIPPEMFKAIVRALAHALVADLEEERSAAVQQDNQAEVDERG